MTDIAKNVNVSPVRSEGLAPLAERDLPHVAGGRSEGGCIIGDVKITFTLNSRDEARHA